VTGHHGIRRGYIDAAAGQVHYREAGRRGSPALLLLHQSPSSSAMYKVLMRQLADRFHLLAPDTPGFGNSDPLQIEGGAIEIRDYAAVIAEFLAAFEVAPCCVFGHHTGAATAVQLEHDFPGTARAMALSGPTLLTEEQRKTLPQRATALPLAEDGAHLQAMWQRIREKDHGAPDELIQREVLSAFVAGPAYHASYEAVCRQDFAAQLDSIQCPVLVFAGDEDPLYAAVDPTVARLAHGERADLPGGERTYVCERQADDVARLLLDFFQTGEQ
jgi:pimeloyl-ACP methyl ester carboxylesterase